MDDALRNMPHEVFIADLTTGTFTIDEAAEKILSYGQATPSQEIELAEAIVRTYGYESTPGPIRTAIRSLHGLPPLPEDASHH